MSHEKVHQRFKAKSSFSALPSFSVVSPSIFERRDDAGRVRRERDPREHHAVPDGEVLGDEQVLVEYPPVDLRCQIPEIISAFEVFERPNRIQIS